MPAGEYEYDSEADLWIRAGDPPEFGLSFEQATDGRYFQRGPNLYYAPDSRFVGRIAYVSGSRLNVTDEGVVYLHNEVARYQLGQEPGEDVQFSGSIRGEVRLPSGETLTLDGEHVSLTPIGELVYIRTVFDPSRPDYLREGDTRLGGGGYRLATPSELLDRGLSGWLLKNRQGDLEEIRQSMIDSGDLEASQSLYDVAQFVAAQLSIRGQYTYDLSARVGL